MKRKLDNSMSPIAENSLALMPPSSNAELFERHPNLDPVQREAPVRILVRRAKSCATREIPVKGEQYIQLHVLAPDDKFVIHTSTISERAAIECLKLAVEIFKPEAVDFSHHNGDLALLSQLWKTYNEH